MCWLVLWWLVGRMARLCGGCGESCDTVCAHGLHEQQGFVPFRVTRKKLYAWLAKVKGGKRGGVGVGCAGRGTRTRWRAWPQPNT